MLKIDEIKVNTHERVIYGHDDEANFHSYIAVHSTELGSSLGGLRQFNYGENNEDALKDVLRLSEGMTYKNSLAGLDLGGGKGVINTYYRKTDAQRANDLRLFAEMCNYLEGDYCTAEDVGTSSDDIALVGKYSKYTPPKDEIDSNPSPATAYGVLVAMSAAIDHKNGYVTTRGRFKDVTVAIQGLGAVGYALAEMLHRNGAHVIASDINADACKRIKKEHGITCVHPDEIYDVEADVFSPCAMGAILTDETVERLKVKVICGSANNQLDIPETGYTIKNKKIIYVPDFLANAGGVVNVAKEFGIVPSDFHIANMVNDIYGRAYQCLTRAAAELKPPHVIADEMAKERLVGAGLMIKLN